MKGQLKTGNKAVEDEEEIKIKSSQLKVKENR